MVKSKHEKKDEELRTEDKRGAEEKPVWYKTWWGVLIAIFVILMSLLIVWGKPKWIKIEVPNVYVALIAVGLAYVFLRFLRVRSRVVKFIFGLLWLLLLPNTAYLFTDLGHIVYQWNNTASLSGHVSLIVQYLLMELFGIITFLYSFFPFEKIIDRVTSLALNKFSLVKRVQGPFSVSKHNPYLVQISSRFLSAWESQPPPKG